MEIGGGTVVLQGGRDGLASTKFLMSGLATGLIEDAWSSTISREAMCLFRFVIVLIEERGGQPRDLLCVIVSGKNV